MADPIQVNYTPDGDDWTVAVKGRGQTLTGTAVGLIAARDRADQLVEKLTQEETHKTVVHLLNGDAVEFTTAYLTARLAKTEPTPPLVIPPSANPEDEPPEAEARVAPPAQTPTPAPRPSTPPEQPAAESKPEPATEPKAETQPTEEPANSST
jgi:outer membrane biosynthesis protein TonB